MIASQSASIARPVALKRAARGRCQPVRASADGKQQVNAVTSITIAEQEKALSKVDIKARSRTSVSTDTLAHGSRGALQPPSLANRPKEGTLCSFGQS